METSSLSSAESKEEEILGHCNYFFFLAVLFDVVGISLMVAGVFSAERYWDMLLYLGACFYFMSLLWWVCWFSGNIKVVPDNPSKPCMALEFFIILLNTISQLLSFEQRPRTSFSSTLSSVSLVPYTQNSSFYRQALKAQGMMNNSQMSLDGLWKQVHKYASEDVDGKAKCRRTHLVPWHVGQGRVQSWFSKCLKFHSGKVAVQSPSPTPLSSQEQLLHSSQSSGNISTSPSLSSASARPSLAYEAPRCPGNSHSIPLLYNTRPPLHVLPSKSYPAVLQDPSLEAPQ